MKSLFKKSFSSFFNNDKPKKVYTDEPVEFEDAISETSFGKFNIFMMAFMFLVSSAFIYDTTVMSYVIPSAECDLNISLLDKGLLVAVVHIGMISSALFSGYLADTIGRKAILLNGLVFDAIFNTIATFSHSFILTLLCKFFSGAFMAGISTVQVTMMAEFHSSKYRSSITMFCGFTFSCAMLTAPLIAWLILTDPYDIHIGTYEFHSWQMFLGACSLPSILACCFIYLVPESPKFLASRNRTEEALAVMRRIYSINTGKPEDTFPIKSLMLDGKTTNVIENKNDKTQMDSKENGNSTNDDVIITREPEKINTPAANLKHEKSLKKENKFVGFMMSGMRQMKPLFKSPHVTKLILLITIQFVGVMAQNSIRLWLPQLFKMMSEYGDEDGTFCDMISLGNKTIVETPQPLDGTCEPIKVAAEAYFNSMIVAGVQVAIGAITSLTINFIGRKNLLVSSMFTSGVCTLAIYWSINKVQVTALASFSVALALTSVNCLISTNVDLFPTTLRAMALSLTLMIGRIGSISGNLMFPALLALGCLPPFLTLACGLFGGTLLCFLIPLPSKNVT